MQHTFSQLMQFPHKFRLARVIRTRGGKEGVVPVAKAIYDAHLSGIGHFRAIIPFFLNVCYTVDRVKIETIGQTAPTDVSNDVQNAIGHEVIKKVSWDDRDINWIDELCSNFHSNSEVMSRWGTTKLSVLLNAMRHLSQTRNFAMQRLAINEHLMSEAETQYELTEVHLRDVMERLVELRKYGVKSSFTRRGFAPSAGNSAWVMWDSREFLKTIGVSRKGLIASVALATAADQIKDIRLKPKQNTRADSSGLEIPFPASFIWQMGLDGELDVLSGIGSMPVRDVFHRLGNDIIYQAVRARLIYHLYDLVVPVAKLATLPSADTPKAGIVEKLRTLLGQTNKVPVVDLIIPRMRILEDRPSLIEAAEQEIERAAIDTEKRSIRRHDVTDFIRPLPKGHRPSAVARQRAFEAFGVVLGDNETYVRSHHRGSGEAITAHEAKSR